MQMHLQLPPSPGSNVGLVWAAIEIVELAVAVLYHTLPVGEVCASQWQLLHPGV